MRGIDQISRYEMLPIGLHGGEFDPYPLEATSKCVQAKALRCTKQKRPLEGALLFLWY